MTCPSTCTIASDLRSKGAHPELILCEWLQARHVSPPEVQGIRIMRRIAVVLQSSITYKRRASHP